MKVAELIDEARAEAIFLDDEALPVAAKLMRDLVRIIEAQRDALHNISVVGIIANPSDTPVSKRMRAIARAALELEV
jgi:hypothetical protein